ncbi:kinetochore-associated protein NSL1 homolog [Narcine bancroftii]|uniref:kinetochore-associated protein NSL1 homolog n=1 Tax=Narcine bancroftii TaxID=1343680 RepID=UPI0038313973
MEAGGRMASQGGRVRCGSRRAVRAAIERVFEPLRERLQGERLEEARRLFEAAVQDNVLINGMLWQEVSEEEELKYGNGIQNLDDDLDECIKETASKRKQIPRKIVGQLAKTMKAERELLKLYQPVVNLQVKMEAYPEQASKETIIMQMTSSAAQDMNDAIKDLPAFKKKAEGLLQTLSLVPVMRQSQTNKTVFSKCTEIEFNNHGQAFPVGKTDITPIEIDENKLLGNCRSRNRKRNSPVNHKYPKRRLHLGL